MDVSFGTFCECGPRRRNEDYVASRLLPEHGRSLFVLCDGMGGHDCGEVASRLVADHICRYWSDNPDRPDSEEKVLDACRKTKIAFDNCSRREMGTTMAMVAIEGDRALLAHCGDSRIYAVRNGEILYQSTVHAALTPEGWPVITRAFFTGSNNFHPDIHQLTLEPGDMILICSDGVYGNGKWSELQKVLLGGESASILNDIEEAAGKHAHDNYSAILIRVN